MPSSRPHRPSRPAAHRAPAPGDALPAPLRRAVDHAGYYPDLVADVVAVALGGEEVTEHLVHQETTFDGEEVRRHVTVVVLTPSRLVVAHADDGTDLVEGPAAAAPRSHAAAATTEAVPLAQVRSVLLSHVVQRPDRYRGGDPSAELTVTIGWGSVQRLDLEPASCADPQCEADHGYSGSLAGDDVVLRVSAAADGADAVARALRFAAALSAATGGRARA
ncbi:DUF5998 family protein [Pseudokineococcus sp. 1T1Z-3]|uniref:DUF5998 family protein n=1 Tax=Pseudokineococcus sp. 1T1Z-3 TaxID=3132745 RepID=UPI0030ACAE2B